MTVTYTAEVATCRGFGCFLKLLLRWRGSIYKLVWLDLLAFLSLYYVLSLTYRFALNPHQKVVFEGIVKYCYNYSDLIPLSFVLGFYVSVVMTRWWSQYTSIPWPDPIAVFVSANVHGQDERGRVMRRTIMRYVCLCLTMVLINVSPRVKKRFPDLSHLVEAGLLNDNEKTIIESMNKSFPRHSKHWLPIVWAASIVTRARKEGRIRDDFAVKTIIDELNKFRGQCGLLISYDTISVPLVYTQVVTLAVYSYFLCGVMAQQWTESNQMADVNKFDMYFPVFTTLQFFFYMGWLKVAEQLINPFGDDDDDFEVNWMVDRNLQVSYLIVDEMHHEHPQLLKDQYWDEVFPNELPYTVASERFREEHPEPSTAKIEVSKTAAMSTTMSGVRIDEMVGSSREALKPGARRPSVPATMQSDIPMQTAVNYKFPDNTQEEEGDDASGIHFIAGNGKIRQGSSPSLVSLSGTLSRVNTVASALKRFLSREDPSRATTPVDEAQKNYFPASASTASLTATGTVTTTTKPMGSLRLADQVIEEVDEQATITSQRANAEVRPNVRDIFAHVEPGASDAGSSSRTQPIDIPPRMTPYSRTHSQVDPHLYPPGGVEALLSTSAPVNGSQHMGGGTVPNTPTAESTKSLFEREDKQRGSHETVEDIEASGTAAAPDAIDEGDDFDKLKATREKERLERQKQKIARSMSTTPLADAVAVAPAIVASIVQAGAPLGTEAQTTTTATPAAAAAACPPIATQTSDSLDANVSTSSHVDLSLPPPTMTPMGTQTNVDTSNDPMSPVAEPPANPGVQ